nr:uncharacterized protein LOC105871650 isoform X2 [Microcebus murinus]
MGRNTVPEVKPPTPSPRAGDVPEGNHSLLHHPPFPSPQRFPCLAPPPLSALPPLLGGGRELCVTRAVLSPPAMARNGGRLGCSVAFGGMLSVLCQGSDESSYGGPKEQASLLL